MKNTKSIIFIPLIMALCIIILICFIIPNHKIMLFVIDYKKNDHMKRKIIQNELNVKKKKNFLLIKKLHEEIQRLYFNNFYQPVR